jgi:hypothetical protein
MFEIDKPKNAKELALSRLQSVRMRAHSVHINGYVGQSPIHNHFAIAFRMPAIEVRAMARSKELSWCSSAQASSEERRHQTRSKGKR